jgi:drug/metabolite transporter (DMT)-like permease
MGSRCGSVLARFDERQDRRHGPQPWTNLFVACLTLLLGFLWTVWAATTHEPALLAVTVVLYPLIAAFWYRRFRRDLRRRRLASRPDLHSQRP